MFWHIVPKACMQRWLFSKPQGITQPHAKAQDKQQYQQIQPYAPIFHYAPHSPTWVKYCLDHVHGYRGG